MKGYIYKTTYLPTGEMYFGSRKLPRGKTPETESYRGSPQKGSNRMAELFETKPAEEFSKKVLFKGSYAEALELENLVIEAAWEKWGKVSTGGLVTNLVAQWGKAIVFTAETRAKISEANKGKKKSAKARANMSASAKGKKMSAKARANMSKASKGRIPNAIVRKKMSVAHKGKNSGAESGKAKAVINTATGQVWPTATEAAKSQGITRVAMSARIARGTNGGIWKYV